MGTCDGHYAFDGIPRDSAPCLQVVLDDDSAGCVQDAKSSLNGAKSSLNSLAGHDAADPDDSDDSDYDDDDDDEEGDWSQEHLIKAQCGCLSSNFRRLFRSNLIGYVAGADLRFGMR